MGVLSIGDNASDLSRSEDVVEAAVEVAAAGVESCFPCEKRAGLTPGLTPRCDSCRACCCC